MLHPFLSSTKFSAKLSSAQAFAAAVITSNLTSREGFIKLLCLSAIRIWVSLCLWNEELETCSWYGLAPYSVEHSPVK